MSLICVQVCIFLSPVSTVSARNAWEHGLLIGAHRQKKNKEKKRQQL